MKVRSLNAGPGCVFCGASPVTKEHVFSTKWLAGIMRPTTSFTTSLMKAQPGQAAEEKTWTERRTKKKDDFGPAVNCACAKCNNEWMQQMDERVKPVITPLALGERGTVSSQGVELLATWATKIALVLDSGLNPGALDPKDKAAFREEPNPRADSQIWIGTASPVEDRARTRASTLTPGSSDDAEGYIATFGVVHLVFQVFLPLRPSLVVRHRDDVARFMHPFWPEGHGRRLSWPVPEKTWLTSEQDFEDVASKLEARS